MDRINISSVLDKYKVFVFDLDNTLYLHNVDYYYNKEYVRKVKIFLDILKTNNKILCIATHNKEPYSILGKMNMINYFDEIIYEKRNVSPWTHYISEYTNKKEMLYEIINKINVSVNEVVFFDDVDYNINEVQSIGVKSIKVSPVTGIQIENEICEIYEEITVES